MYVCRAIYVYMYVPTKSTPHDTDTVTSGGVKGHRIFHTESMSSGQSAQKCVRLCLHTQILNMRHQHNNYTHSVELNQW